MMKFPKLLVIQERREGHDAIPRIATWRDASNRDTTEDDF